MNFDTLNSGGVHTSVSNAIKASSVNVVYDQRSDKRDQPPSNLSNA